MLQWPLGPSYQLSLAAARQQGQRPENLEPEVPAIELRTFLLTTHACSPE